MVGCEEWVEGLNVGILVMLEASSDGIVEGVVDKGNKVFGDNVVGLNVGTKVMFKLRIGFNEGLVEGDITRDGLVVVVAVVGDDEGIVVGLVVGSVVGVVNEGLFVGSVEGSKVLSVVLRTIKLNDRWCVGIILLSLNNSNGFVFCNCCLIVKS